MLQKLSILPYHLFIMSIMLISLSLSGSSALALDPGRPMPLDRPDGEYSIEVTLEGGSGKASVASPAVLAVKDGKAYASLVWSSSNYDYMVVGEDKYENTAAENAPSTFEVPVAAMDAAIPVIADTTAMGTPHEIEYTLTFHSDSLGSKSQLPQEAAKRVLFTAFLIIVLGGILNHFVKKRYYD